MATIEEAKQHILDEIVKGPSDVTKTLASAYRELVEAEYSTKSMEFHLRDKEDDRTS